jgi:hypothetical protein
MSTAACDSPVPESLLRRINYERTTSVPYQSADFKLDRMRQLLSLLGDPHYMVSAGTTQRRAQ